MSLILCDSHRMFLDGLAFALGTLGHEVVASAERVDDLVDLVHEHDPGACVTELPRGAGHEDALRQVRQNSPGVGIVLLTSSVDGYPWEAYRRDLADAVVSKACNLRVIDRSLRQVLEGQRVAAGGINRVPARGEVTRLEHLTDREREVLALIAGGASTVAMSACLGVSSSTVRTHVQNVMQKLQVTHRTKAALVAAELGLVPTVA